MQVQFRLAFWLDAMKKFPWSRFNLCWEDPGIVVSGCLFPCYLPGTFARLDVRRLNREMVKSSVVELDDCRVVVVLVAQASDLLSVSLYYSHGVCALDSRTTACTATTSR